MPNETWTPAEWKRYQETGIEPARLTPHPLQPTEPAKPRKPTASEADHQRAVFRYLTILEASGEVYAFHVPNERKGDVTRAILSGLGVRSGVSDLVIMWMGGRTTFLELKREGATTSDNQEAFIDRARRMGFEAEWSDNLARSVEIIDGWRTKCK